MSRRFLTAVLLGLSVSACVRAPSTTPVAQTPTPELSPSADATDTPAPSVEPTASPTPEPEPAVLLAAGDVADCELEGVALTTELLAGLVADHPDATIAVLGDVVYPSATAEQLASCYDPTWGRFADRTRPAIGNHDMDAEAGAHYYAAFGEAAGTPGEGWYSYELGEWHVVVLNANCDRIACEVGSPQHTWLVDGPRRLRRGVHAGLLAPPALHVRPARRRPAGRSVLDGAHRRGSGRRPRRPRPPLRALHAAGRRRLRGPERPASVHCRYRGRRHPAHHPGRAGQRGDHRQQLGRSLARPVVRLLPLVIPDGGRSRCRYGRSGLPRLTPAQPASGFRQRTSEKRAKSVSAEQISRPCWMAIAARCAS